VESAIKLTGPQYVSAVITEAMASGPLGGLVSPPEYLRRVRGICDQYDALLIVDEIVSGLGRTGQWFAIEESGIVPDVITLAKGLGGGLMPMGAVLVHDKVYEPFRTTGTSFVHGESFTGHLLLGTAGSAVVEFIRDNDLLERVNQIARRLDARLNGFTELPMVGEVRGRGALRGIELVRDKRTKEPFPRAWQASENVLAAAATRNVLLLAGNGCADGINGDTVVLAPPYVITDEQLDQVVNALAAALQQVSEELTNRT
jgi:adenosylmethionine-8-amino-7-oxononanoate aminotransferase